MKCSREMKALKQEELKQLGRLCQKHRTGIGKYQSAVSCDTGYAIETISAFERGRNDNSKILFWYIYNGLSIKEVLKIWRYK